MGKKKCLPPYVVEKGEKWFVRKSVAGADKKQKQMWRVCEPKTAARAEQLLAEMKRALDERITGRAPILFRFSDVAAEFERAELVEAVYAGERKIAGRRSLDSPRAILRMLKEYFGSRPLNSITFGDLETFKAERLKTPVVFKYKSRPRSLKAVNYELSFLRQIFNFAYRRRWIDRSPFRDGKNLIDTANENRRHTLWTPDEEARALELCVGRYAHLKPVIILIRDGGFRRGELLGAKWSDVDFEKEIILAKSYKGKSLSIRPIFMTERRRAVLLEWRKEQKSINRIVDKSLVIGCQLSVVGSQ